MPIQVSRGCFVGFVYDPDYNKHFREQEANLRWIPEWCRERGFTCLSTPIVLDGGNVVREGNITIVTEKIFRENPGYGRRQLLRELESLLQVDRIVLVPQDSSDVFGHADGMVRFIDSGTVLANRCSAKEDRDFAAGFSKALRGAGLQIVYVPYNPYANRTTLDAKGIYINYLRTRDAVVVPVFRLKEDKEAARIIEESFPGAKLLEIEVTEIAKLGGVLNCISWTIMF
jgi:agmatine deiminase